MPAPGGALDDVTEFFGFRFEAPGVIRLTIRPELINLAGILSGAVSYAMVDYAMGSALWAQRNEDEGIATLSISVNYLQTAIDGRHRLPRRRRPPQPHRGDAARDRRGR